MKTPLQELIDFLEPELKMHDFSQLPAYEKAKDLLEKEAQLKKNNCIEFLRYIRNGKDHFNNGHSTEMVYDEWIEKKQKTAIVALVTKLL